MGMAAKSRKRFEQPTGKHEGRDVAFQGVRPVVVAHAEANRGHQPETSEDQERSKSNMTVESMSEETARDGYRAMAQTWKDGYLQGLNLWLQWQEGNERLIRDSVKQGLSGSRQFLTWFKDRVEDQRRVQE